MPRLDGGDSSSHPASAYPRRGFSPFRVMLYFMMFMSLKNILTKNYRNEEKSYLRSSGMSDEEIEKFVPKTQLERDILRRKKTVNELQLMREIELLKEQVKELQAKVFNGTVPVKSTDVESGNDPALHEAKPAKLKESKDMKEAEKDKL
ncbi:hypothetical protein ACHAWO_003746 [Cyclotella atomus]|uniref:Uncharacterized protein n=1 Tax=Cyclotella atomus TaxID=382360 RepID=A0ABD3P4J9_9STRA